MPLPDLSGQLQNLETENIITFLGQFDLATYIRNPIFLGTMGVLAILCLFFKWRLLLSTIVGITGLAWLISYTVARGTGIDEGLRTQNLLVFVGGAVAIIFVMIYLVFIKHD